MSNTVLPQQWKTDGKPRLCLAPPNVINREREPKRKGNKLILNVPTSPTSPISGREVSSCDIYLTLSQVLPHPLEAKQKTPPANHPTNTQPIPYFQCPSSSKARAIK